MTASSELNRDAASLRPALIKVARRFAPCADAEDLVQEALARALERRDGLRAGTNLRAWVKPVMRNLAIDEQRRARRLRPLDEAAALPETAEERPFWADFDRGHVERALRRCAPELRSAFELHYWQSLSLDAIAHRLGVPRSTVGTRLHRARAQVRRALEHGGHSGEI